MLRTGAGGDAVSAPGSFADCHKSVRLDCGYRLDIVVENQVIIEVKSVERLMPIHEAQVITYLKLRGIATGLLLNFNTAVLKDGVRRLALRI